MRTEDLKAYEQWWSDMDKEFDVSSGNITGYYRSFLDRDIGWYVWSPEWDDVNPFEKFEEAFGRKARKVMLGAGYSGPDIPDGVQIVPASHVMDGYIYLR